jgi:endogenous inhibitor of DNA gyrase (YacG/DUF329 family)
MATPKKARLLIPCEACGTPFEQRNARGRFCSGKCRAAAWQANRKAELALVEESLTRTLERVRGIWRTTREK